MRGQTTRILAGPRVALGLVSLWLQGVGFFLHTTSLTLPLAARQLPTARSYGLQTCGLGKPSMIPMRQFCEPRPRSLLPPRPRPCPPSPPVAVVARRRPPSRPGAGRVGAWRVREPPLAWRGGGADWSGLEDLETFRSDQRSPQVPPRFVGAAGDALPSSFGANPHQSFGSKSKLPWKASFGL